MSSGATGPDAELRSMLDTYSKRLRVVENVLRDTGAPEDAVARVERVRLENAAVIDRLRSPVADNLENLWNVTRMKAAYYPLIKKVAKLNALVRNWGREAEAQEALKKHNREVIGETDSLKYVHARTFPNVITDHLFDVMNFVRPFRNKAALERVTDLVEWLEQDQSTLSSIKGCFVDIVKKDKIEDEVILEKAKGRLSEVADEGGCYAKLYMSENFLVILIPPSIPFLGTSKIEYDFICKLTVEKDEEENSLVLSGLGSRKFITLRSEEERDNFCRAFDELKK